MYAACRRLGRRDATQTANQAAGLGSPPTPLPAAQRQRQPLCRLYCRCRAALLPHRSPGRTRGAAASVPSCGHRGCRPPQWRLQRWPHAAIACPSPTTSPSGTFPASTSPISCGAMDTLLRHKPSAPLPSAPGSAPRDPRHPIARAAGPGTASRLPATSLQRPRLAHTPQHFRGALGRRRRGAEQQPMLRCGPERLIGISGSAHEVSAVCPAANRLHQG